MATEPLHESPVWVGEEEMPEREVESKKFKVLIAIPHMGFVSAELSVNLINWSSKNGVNIMMPGHLSPVAFARNFCADRFMATDHTHLWFIDADTCPPYKALAELLQADLPVVSGVTPAWKFPMGKGDSHKFVPTISLASDKGYSTYWGNGKHEIERIDSCGAACLMIRRDAFEKLVFPYFEERSWGGIRGEDIIFCEKLAEAGIPLYAHFGVQCVHRKTINMTIAEGVESFPDEQQGE